MLFNFIIIFIIKIYDDSYVIFCKMFCIFDYNLIYSNWIYILWLFLLELYGENFVWLFFFFSVVYIKIYLWKYILVYIIVLDVIEIWYDIFKYFEYFKV